jgi:hypothetical protein
LLYPNFGHKNTCSKFSFILDICLLILKNCQFATVYTDILLCFISQFNFKDLFDCVFVYVFLHFKSSKKHFSCISSHLNWSLINCIVLCILFQCYLQNSWKRGILVISCIQTHFSPWKLFESFQLVCISPYFNFMLKSTSKIAFESFRVSLAPRGILVISYVKTVLNLWKLSLSLLICLYKLLLWSPVKKPL